MNIFKKFIALNLSIVMMLSIVSTTVFAEEAQAISTSPTEVEVGTSYYYQSGTYTFTPDADGYYIIKGYSPTVTDEDEDEITSFIALENSGTTSQCYYFDLKASVTYNISSSSNSGYFTVNATTILDLDKNGTGEADIFTFTTTDEDYYCISVVNAGITGSNLKMYAAHGTVDAAEVNEIITSGHNIIKLKANTKYTAFTNIYDIESVKLFDGLQLTTYNTGGNPISVSKYDRFEITTAGWYEFKYTKPNTNTTYSSSILQDENFKTLYNIGIYDNFELTDAKYTNQYNYMYFEAGTYWHKLTYNDELTGNSIDAPTITQVSDTAVIGENTISDLALATLYDEDHTIYGTVLEFTPTEDGNHKFMLTSQNIAPTFRNFTVYDGDTEVTATDGKYALETSKPYHIAFTSKIAIPYDETDVKLLIIGPSGTIVGFDDAVTITYGNHYNYSAVSMLGDVTFTFYDSDETELDAQPVDVGEYTVKVSDGENEKEGTFVIEAKTVTDVTGVTGSAKAEDPGYVDLSSILNSISETEEFELEITTYTTAKYDDIEVEDNALNFVFDETVNANDTDKVVITVSSHNYEDFTITITLTCTDVSILTFNVEDIEMIYTGGYVLNTNSINGTATFGGKEVLGTFSFDSKATNFRDSGTDNVDVLFTPTDADDQTSYGTDLLAQNISVTIVPATFEVIVKDATIELSDITNRDLDDLYAQLGITYTLNTTLIKESDSDYDATYFENNYLNDTDVPVWDYYYIYENQYIHIYDITETGEYTIQAILGSHLLEDFYKFVFNKVNANYNITYGTLSVVDKIVDNNSSSNNNSSSSSTTTTPEPTPEPTPETTTETQENSDGSTSEVVTNTETGEVTTTTTYDNGVEVEQVTTATGNTTATISNITEKSKVLIALEEEPTTSQVAVIIYEDGTSEIIMQSVATEDGLLITLSENARIEIIDNSKSFNDVSTANWFADAVDFVTSREIFNGTTEESFSADTKMSRAMLWTVLYRYDGGTGETTGANWYNDAQAWSIENGISDGTNPSNDMSREQLATILYRFEGEPELDSTLETSETISSWAENAMNWAVAQGLIEGDTDGALNPTNSASRAEVATILMRYIKL